MARYRGILLSAGVTLAMVVGARVEAQRVLAEAPPVLHGCYVTGTGTVYLITEPGLPTSCPASSVAFQWTDGDQAIRIGSAAGGDLSGTYPDPQVVALLGRLIDQTPPTDGQVLRFDAASGTWKPVTLSGGGGGTTDHGELTERNKKSEPVKDALSPDLC